MAPKARSGGVNVRFSIILTSHGNGRSWPILLKNSISADSPKILALIRRDARVDVGDHEQSAISHPKVS